MLSKLNLNGGELIFENISTYTESTFQENLLFIKYGKRYCVDVDWNPLALPHGLFFIRVIEDCDWDAPLLELYSDPLCQDTKMNLFRSHDHLKVC